MEIYTQQKRPPKVMESGGRPNKVDNTGYISTQKRIENLLAAGKRLVEYRSNQFDFPEGKEIDEDNTDPTRERALDPADVFQVNLAVEARLAEQKARVEALKRSEENLWLVPGKVEKARKDDEEYRKFKEFQKSQNPPE